MNEKIKTGYTKKNIYLIITVLLGYIGIHKFYARKYFVGTFYLIMYACFYWTPIPYIMVLIDFLVALFKKEDMDGMIQL